MFFNAFLALSLRTLLVWENKRLDQKYADQAEPARHEKTDGDTNVGEENYGKSFRYIL